MGHRLLCPPHNKQASLFATRKVAIRWTLSIILALPVLVLVWAGIVLHAWKKNNTAISFNEFASGHTKLDLIFTTWTNAPAIRPFPLQQDPGPAPHLLSASTTNFVCLILVFCIQAYVTFALHCIEVLVNSARDQRTWEKAAKHLKSKARGAPLNANVISTFLASPPNIFLLAAKVVAHWLFNQSLLPIVVLSNYYDSTKWEAIESQINLFGVPTLFLAGVALLLLAMAWYEACRSPRGAQPSTFGHVQTLMELIDEWGDGNQLFWGDTGMANDGVSRRSGVSGSADAVGPIHFDAEYI